MVEFLSNGTHNIKSWLRAKFYLSTSNPNWIPLSDSVDYYIIQQLNNEDHWV